MSEKPCACGCPGTVDPGGNGRRKYLPKHRQRAYRKRVKVELQAAGLPVSLSLKTLQAKGTSNERNGDAQRSRKPARKRRDLGVRLYISTQEAEALARGETPATVSAKATAKLKAPGPIPGQMDLVTEIAREEGTACNPVARSTPEPSSSASGHRQD